MTGDIKPGRKAQLAALIADGSLAQGLEEQDQLLRGLNEGRAESDTAYMIFEGDLGPRARDFLEEFFEIDKVLDVDRVRPDDLSRIERMPTPLPEWAGVDMPGAERPR